MTTLPEPLIYYQKLSSRLLEYAVDDAEDRNSSRALEITEGRHGKGYSSCADLLHWLYFRLGVRLPWINRNEHQGWRVGVNISRLAAHSTFYRRGDTFDAGDGVIITSNGYDAHAIAVITDLGDGLLATAEYGQPGGMLKLPMVIDGKIGRRPIKYVLRLEAVLLEAAEAGLLEPPDLPKGMKE